MKPETCVVLITAPDREVGEKIARRLVEMKLAACVSIVAPLTSIYSWKGEVVQEEEVLLICKTTDGLVEPRLIPAVLSMHPYEVPEIVALPIQSGSSTYLDWIRSVTA